MICTIYKNIISKEPHYITVEDALSRISNGRTKDLVEAIRRTIDKNSIQELKKTFHLFALVENLKEEEKIKI